MNILFLRPRAEMGGATRHMLSLSAELARRGHRVILGASGGEWLDRFPAVQRLPLYPSTPYHLAASAAAVVKIVRRDDIHILHSHHRFSTLAGNLAARLAGVPLVGMVHEFKTNWRWLAGLWVAPWVCVPSLALKEHLVRHYGVAAERVSVVRLGARPVVTPDPAAARLRGLWGAAFPGPLVGYVGRLAPEKGVDVLLRALPDVFAAHPDSRAVIIGEGEERPRLEALAGALGLAERVRFMGERADAPECMPAMQVVVAPSLSESFGLAAAEAMAAGRPVVASAVGGLVEMVEDGVTGYLVPASDAGALAGRIRQILADPAGADAMGRAGQQKAAQWSPAKAAELTEAVYRRALG